MKRRAVVLALVLVALLIPAVIDRGGTTADAVQFGELLHEPVPFGRVSERISSSWFCPALPARSGEKGSVRVLNPGIADLTGTVTIWENERPEPIRLPISVAPGSSKSVDIIAANPGDVNTAMVEMVGGEVYVESTVKVGASTVAAYHARRARPALGRSSKDRPTSTPPIGWRYSTRFPATPWWMWTPSPTRTASRPGARQGSGGKRPESEGDKRERAGPPGRALSLVVRSRGGNVVVGRLLALNTTTRQGLIAGVATAGDASSLWWAGGDTATGAAEQVLVLNANEDRAELDLSIYPATAPTNPATQLVRQVSVPPQSVVAVDISGIAAAGRPARPGVGVNQRSQGGGRAGDRRKDQGGAPGERGGRVPGGGAALVLGGRRRHCTGFGRGRRGGGGDEPTSTAVKVSVRQVVPGGSRVLSEVDVAPGVPARIKLSGVSATEVLSLFVRADTPIVVERRRLREQRTVVVGYPVL